MRENDKKYCILFIFLSLLIIVIPFFIPYGGVNADVVAYFKLAKDFPYVKDNLFPVGYPILLKIGYFFTHEFYFSSRIIGILSYITIGIFSYYKRFYFKETVVLLSFKFFLSLYVNSFSENIFQTLLYFQIYYFHEYFSGQKKGYKFVLPAVFISIYMVMVRYSGIYIYLGICLFFIYYMIKNKQYLNIFFQEYFYYCVFAFIGIGIYLGYNYLNFGSFFGEQIRGEPEVIDKRMFTYENLLGAINVANPFYSVKITSQLGISVILLLVDLLFFIGFIIFHIKYSDFVTPFHQLLLITGGVFLTLMFYSEYKQSIEILNMRLLAAASFLFIFSFLILYYKIWPERSKYMLICVCISLFFFLVYQLKNPVNYLSNKIKVDKIYKEKKNIKYFCDDTQGEKVVSVYKIPFINKKIEHIHPYMQSGFINSTIVRTINPDVILLENDSLIKDKSLILYNSELK